MFKNIFLCGMMFIIAAAAYAGEPAVAKVNGAVITARELEEAINTLIPQSTYHRKVAPERRNDFREKALEDLITRELQYQDAVRRGLKPDEKLVTAQMEQIRGRYKSKDEYRKALEQSGLTEERLREEVRKNALVQQAVEIVVTVPSQMGEAELREYYGKNLERFIQPDSVRLRVISMKDGKKAKEARAQLDAGEDFGDVAARSSEDRFRIMGGDVGYIHRGRVLPEVEKEAFALKPGQVAGPIKAGELWYLIKVEEKQPERQLSFDEVKAGLKKELEGKRSQDLMKQWVDGLRSKAAVEIMPAEKH